MWYFLCITENVIGAPKMRNYFGVLSNNSFSNITIPIESNQEKKQRTNTKNEAKTNSKNEVKN